MTSASLPYKPAHKVRHGHALYGQLHARTPADFEAVSMNLMHSSTRITVETYAFLAERDVREHILRLADNPIVEQNRELETIIHTAGNDKLGHVFEVIAERIAG